MRTLLPIALLTTALLLPACEREPTPENGAVPAPSPTPSAAPVLGPAPAAAPATTEAVRPGELRTFGDWAVACDNTRLCEMASLGRDGDLPSGVTMQLLRQPGAPGAVDLSFDTVGDDAAVRPVALAIDGRRMPLPSIDGRAATAVARAMADGRALTVIERGDRTAARLSLVGASAALRWIDAQQGRADTTTALVARGDQPADAVPPAAPGPTVRAVPATDAVTKPTKVQLTRMYADAGCDERAASGVFGDPETHALGDGATLVMLPCSTGAYNLSSALFVLRDGQVAPAATDAPVGFDATPAAGRDRIASTVNGAWKDGEVTSDAKGRGLGDCGVHQTFVWDGTRFRLVEQSEMRECRGNPHFLTTWRAQVVPA